MLYAQAVYNVVKVQDESSKLITLCMCVEKLFYIFLSLFISLPVRRFSGVRESGVAIGGITGASIPW